MLLCRRPIQRIKWVCCRLRMQFHPIPYHTDIFRRTAIEGNRTLLVHVDGDGLITA